MIDSIGFHTQQKDSGATYDVVRVWIGGIPFSADLSAQVERTARRIASDAGIEVSDNRPIEAVRK